MKQEYIDATGEGRIAAECEYYGSNELGALAPYHIYRDRDLCERVTAHGDDTNFPWCSRRHEWQYHCGGYIDQDDPIANSYPKVP